MSELESAKRPHAAVLIAIAVGGALGAPARYEVAQLIPITPATFPWATFWTNVSGAFVLGVFLTIVIERFPPTRFVRPFFGIGFLGVYTTFSTLTVETATLVKDGDVTLGVGYTLATIVAGLTFAVLGNRARTSASDRAPAGCHARRGTGGLMLVAGIAFAGAVGAPLRYLVDRFVQGRTKWVFPLGTFVINVSGSLLLGIISGLALYHAFPGTPTAILGSGFCGGYTTFSTFTYETLALAGACDYGAAVSNVLLSSIVPALAAGAGLALAAL